MTVKDLIAALEKCDSGDLVILQSDSEGNNYSPLSGVSEDVVYVPDGGYYGDVYPRVLTDEEKVQGYTDEDLYDGDKGENAVVL